MAKSGAPSMPCSLIIERRCFEIDLVCGLAGQHHDRRERARCECLAHQIEAGPRSEPVVDQIDVVALFANRIECLLEVPAPIELEVRALRTCEHLARKQVVVLVVLDEQDPE